MDENSYSRVYNLVDTINDKERKLQSERTIFGSFRWAKYFTYILLALDTLLVIFFRLDLCGARNFIGYELAFFLLLGSVYLITAAFAFTLYIQNHKTLSETAKHPHRLFIKNVRLTSEADYSYLSELLQESLHTLQFCSMQLFHEVKGLEKRLGLVIGSLDKVGVLPAVLPFFIALPTVDPNAPDWVQAIIWSIPPLYIAGVAFHYQLSRLTRNHSLLELIIDWKKSGTLPSVTSPTSN